MVSYIIIIIIIAPGSAYYSCSDNMLYLVVIKICLNPRMQASWGRNNFHLFFFFPHPYVARA